MSGQEKLEKPIRFQLNLTTEYDAHVWDVVSTSRPHMGAAGIMRELVEMEYRRIQNGDKLDMIIWAVLNLWESVKGEEMTVEELKKRAESFVNE